MGEGVEVGVAGSWNHYPLKKVDRPSKGKWKERTWRNGHFGFGGWIRVDPEGGFQIELGAPHPPYSNRVIGLTSCGYKNQCI